MSTLHTSSTLHINPMRFEVLILSPHPHFSDEKTEVQGDGAHCQGFRGSQWLSCHPPCCSPGCDLQHKADALPNSGPPLPPFLPSATLTVFPVGDIHPFILVGTGPPHNPGKLSAPGMTAYLYWVLLQAYCLRPSLHAP